MTDLSKLEHRISKIEERNKRVEITYYLYLSCHSPLYADNWGRKSLAQRYHTGRRLSLINPDPAILQEFVAKIFI